MLETLITSQTRIKLLVRFFINQNNQGYLRGLADEFGESSNAIRIELNRFEKAGLLVSCLERNKKIYKANKNYPLFLDLRNLVLKFIGIDNIHNEVKAQTDDVKEIWVTDVFNFLSGNQNPLLLFVGNNLDAGKLQDVINQSNRNNKRNINIKTMSFNEIGLCSGTHKNKLLLWQSDDKM